MQRAGSRPIFGVTLIEFVVAVAVLAILAAMAVPSFSDFFDKNRVRAAADGLISFIGNARAEAVRNDLDVNVAMAGSGASWCMGANAAAVPTGGLPAGAAGVCDCTDPASATECRLSGQRAAIERDAFPDVQVGALPAPFTFSSQMGVVTPLGSRQVTLTSPRGRYDLTVEVSALGQARLCVPSGKPAIAGIASC